MEELLSSLQLESLTEIFQREHITMDVLVEMTNDDLVSVGVSAFGHRHKILRRTKELTTSTEEEMGQYLFSAVACVAGGCEELGVCLTVESSPVPPPPGPPDPVGVASAEHVGTQLIELLHTDKDFIAVSEEVSVNSLPDLLKCFYISIIFTHVLHVTLCFRCRAQFVLTATMAKQADSSPPTTLSRFWTPL